MNKLALTIILPVLLLVLPGCWSKFELTELGFVMGVALDKGADGQLNVTTQIYRPSRGGGSSKGPTTKVSSINVKTTNSTVFQAVRDITVHLGRKAQWSHMRVVLIGDSLARSVDIGELLDFFFRDHEPRPTVTLMIARGEAGRLLTYKPLIEETTGEQLLRAQKFSQRSSAKSVATTLLSFGREERSATGEAAVSYVYEEKKTERYVFDGRRGAY